MKKLILAGVIVAGSAGVMGEPTVAEIEREIAASEQMVRGWQAQLAKRGSLDSYRAEVTRVNGTNVWSAAFQKALVENEIVVIPASDAVYYLDKTVVIPSNRRIEAKGATVSLLPGMDNVMLRNEQVGDGTLRPNAVPKLDRNVAIVGGRWCDWRAKRAGYGASGRYNNEKRRIGNFYGVSTLFLFNNFEGLLFEDVTFHRTSGFAFQGGDGHDFHFLDTTFDRCFADGYHLNGNLSRVHVKNARGQVGDDLVALNAYDWLNSSVTFGPQRTILCEDLEQVGAGYPAIRIQPAVYRYADGTKVDCAISDVVFRRVKGIKCFKMYLQTPNYAIGDGHEWGEVGSGGNLHFEDVEVDLDRPIDKFEPYMKGDPLRGHFGAFEFGANLTSVYFRNLKVRFHADRFPTSHLAVVGPKSVRISGGNGQAREVFDPWVSCTVGKVVVEGLASSGAVPEELVHATMFDNVNGDGESSGVGKIKTVEIR